ncbi:ApbE family lipoprotein [Pirellula staleyi DSM 6068]|uniref:FAD:protein FMN transferase n=1 Tax=Pirellula staleyi (strain ATCC 27377 / DSM 6068 / ICPB 4128) TaxID=530564 RepID=D2R9D1_PIRSD|nr:ApbE family lipoprotein [Pirellula staleyi DSM 6068]
MRLAFPFTKVFLVARITRNIAAMGTLFELLLLGDDTEHLTDVAEASIAELKRVEQLISRYDPRSEISRINRDAAAQSVQVDREVWELIELGASAWETTGGAFDLTASTPASDQPVPVSFAQVSLDDVHRRVAFSRSDVKLDLGAIGKGYALDRVKQLLLEYGVKQAFVHGGSSSVTAIGGGPQGTGWQIELAVNWQDAPGGLATLSLKDVSLSCSDSHSSETAVSDIIDPSTSAPIGEPRACFCTGPSGVECEAFSTAAIVMGRDRTKELLREIAPTTLASVGWIDQSSGGATLTWLRGGPSR